MAAPSPTSRDAPSGIKLDDGYQTLVTIAADTDIAFWEKSITPPGLDGGDANDTTTMHNTTYRTFAPRALKTMTEMSLVAAYDPDIYDEILAVINTETTITVTFPDGSTLAFFGYVRTFAPSEVVEGGQPEATITVQPTNQDTTGAEQAAVMTEVAGT